MGLLNKKNDDKPMSFEDFHELASIKEKDLEPGDAGILVHEGQHITNDINLGKTRAEIHEALTTLLPGLDEVTLDELTSRAIEHQISKEQLKDFANKEKAGLKVESMDTSAIPQEKTQNPKDTSFVQKVETPTVPQNNDTKAKKEDLNNEGPEI